MKAPIFWYTSLKRPNLIWRLLARLYQGGRALHTRMTTPRLPVIPVICVGNVVTGGAGKTPVVRALYHLIGHDKTYLLSRGYGGHKRGPMVVTPQDNAYDVGDEALLLARTAPTIIARDRYAGTTLIAERGGTLALMDDGLQNRQIYPTLTLMVIDGSTGFGNGHTLPAGPLREPVPEALSRTDALILIGNDLHGTTRSIQNHIPVFTARAVFDTKSIRRDIPYVAFAGLARPEKFFETLRHLSIQVVAEYPFPDHHHYTAYDINTLILAAERTGAQLVTTEKDAVKLPRHLIENGTITILSMEIEFDAPAQLQLFLTGLLKERTSS